MLPFSRNSRWLLGTTQRGTACASLLPALLLSVGYPVLASISRIEAALTVTGCHGAGETRAGDLFISSWQLGRSHPGNDFCQRHDLSGHCSLAKSTAEWPVGNHKIGYLLPLTLAKWETLKT